MTLAVEDGTNVAGAESYISVADAQAYAASRELPMDNNTAKVEVHLRNAFDYIESMRERFQGYRTDPAQSCQWPREGVYVDGVLVGNAIIPGDLKRAQVHLASALHSGLVLQPSAALTPAIVREKVGIDSLETQYSETRTASNGAVVTAAMALIQPLLTTTGPVTVGRA